MRGVPATSLILTAEATTISYSKQIAPTGKAIVALPRMKGCIVTVVAQLQDGAEASEQVNVCNVNTVRLTD